jgi:hypothetical protein
VKPETVVKMRDGFQMVADALQQELESSAPSDVIPDLTGLVWKAATGPQGPYERSDEETANPNYKRLVKALHEHQGTMTVDGYFVWVFTDGKNIGRKPRKKSNE